MKLLKNSMIGACLLILTSQAHAAACAAGYISSVAEGAFDSNDLIIYMNFTSETPPPPSSGYIRFRANLPSERLRGIRALAYLSLVNGNMIEVGSTAQNSQGRHDCERADELRVLKLP